MNRLRLVNRVFLQEEANLTTFLYDAPTPSPTYVTLLPTQNPTPLSQLFPKPTRPSIPSKPTRPPIPCSTCYTPMYSGQDDSNDGGVVFIVIFIVVVVVGVFALYVFFRSSGENEVDVFHSHLA
jgi:hypothetical protein